MSKRDAQLLLKDIIDSIDKIQRYTEHTNLESFVQDDKTIDAVVRNFEIIGEAVNQLPSIFCEQYPQIAWRRMAGFRNVLIHKYFGVDLQIVWEITLNELPVLAQQIQSIISSYSQVR